jgi:aldehyde dehydrogenase (NAD+)
MDIASLIAGQRTFFQSGASRPVAFRRAQLQKLFDAIRQKDEQFYEAMLADVHKSPYASFTTEMGVVLSEIRYALRHINKWAKPKRRRVPLLAWPGRASVQAEPFGVALILGAWNYPFLLLLSPLVGAIAAGNCVVLKPSELAPRTSAVMASVIGQIFPREYIAVVEGGRPAAEALLAEKFDTIFFTGGSAIGRVVMAAAAKNLTPVTLELGGKSPAIVCADAAIDVAARRIAWAKFMNAGQTCVAPDFVLVQRAAYQPFIAAVRKALQEFYGTDPRQNAEYGRIINRRQFDRIAGYLSQGNIAHGGQMDAADLYLAPTILTDAPADAPVMHDEIFGPILPVCPFDTLPDVLALLRDRPTPLALYLFTQDRAVQNRLITQTRSGGMCINDTVLQMINHDLPFGGLGESGFGSYHGKAGFDCFSHHRAILRRSTAIDPRLRYPPPPVTLATIKRAYRWLLGG